MMNAFLIWVETSALSIWVRESPSVFAFPIILSFHTIGMGFLAGMNAAIALRILGFAPRVPLMEARRVFPVLWAGFWLKAVSGIVLLIAYPTKALTNRCSTRSRVALGLVTQTLIRRRVLANAAAGVTWSPCRVSCSRYRRCCSGRRSLSPGACWRTHT